MRGVKQNTGKWEITHYIDKSVGSVGVGEGTVEVEVGTEGDKWWWKKYYYNKNKGYFKSRKKSQIRNLTLHLNELVKE